MAWDALFRVPLLGPLIRLFGAFPVDVRPGQGRAAYAQAIAAIRPKMESLRDGFTQKEFREVLPFLKALRTWLDDKSYA